MQCGQADNSAEQFHDRVQLGAQQRFHSMQPLRVGMTSWSTPAGAWRKLAALINLRSPTIRKQVWRLHNKRRRLLFFMPSGRPSLTSAGLSDGCAMTGTLKRLYYRASGL